MATTFRAACAQITSTPDMAGNIATACDLVREAREAGADLVALPENVALLAPGADMRAAATSEADHPALAAFRDLARDTGVWLLAGSLAVRHGEKLANRSLLIDPRGAVVARYDKIHMFDVDLPGGESYRESKNYAHGDAACLAQTPWGPLGVTICYDMRFAHLYRALAQAGAALFTVPSAFTRPTGWAHWHVLLRARAIETGGFVIAPAQCGTHYGKRQTYGHSLIIDPWGEVLAEAGEEPGVIVAEIDMDRVAEARAMVPSLEHDQNFTPPTTIRPAAE
jgi:predicted amidohydrolase